MFEKEMANVRRSHGPGQVDLMVDLLDKMLAKVREIDEQLKQASTASAQAKTFPKGK